MSNNRTFFKNVREGQMSLGDIFSEVFDRHTPEQTARVFIAGTELTTPKEAEMLAGWQKPFLFSRFFTFTSLVLVLFYILAIQFDHGTGKVLLLILLPLLVPVSVLLLTWEMNVPRDISLMEVIKMVALGGALSMIANFVLQIAGVNPSVTWFGLVEEPAKLIIIILMLKQKNRRYILDGVLIGMAVGTGFAIVETLDYVWGAFTLGATASALDLMITALQQPGATLGGVVEAFVANLDALEYLAMEAGFQEGMHVALIRSINGISGHGLYSALYGGGLLMAKGSEEFQIGHLFSIDHLKYMAAAVLLHAMNNSGVTFGLPVFWEGRISTVLLLNTAVGVVLFLGLLRTGVNQIVKITTAKNGGRVTMAVNRGPAPMPGPAPSPAPAIAAHGEARLECIAGPSVGQVYRCTSGSSLTLGRTAGRCDVALPSCESVSSAHCRITVNGSRVTVTDLNSTNGTYMNNQRLAPMQNMPVMDGSVIYLGNKTCAFRIRIR